MNFADIINAACCDNRVKKGIPDLNDVEFCFVLQEYLINEGISADIVAEKTHMLFEKGRFPERQAYNKDGILVTFPTKEYRDRAVDKGTHFANNPKRADSNIFSQQDLTNADSLSVADIRPDSTGETSTDEKPKDVVSVDSYVDTNVNNSEKESRSKEEKQADSEIVNDMLIDNPLDIDNVANEGSYLDVNEVINNYEKYGMYGKNNNWYNSSGELVGEQIYNDTDNKFYIKLFSK